MFIQVGLNPRKPFLNPSFYSVSRPSRTLERMLILACSQVQ